MSSTVCASAEPTARSRVAAWSWVGISTHAASGLMPGPRPRGIRGLPQHLGGVTGDDRPRLDVPDDRRPGADDRVRTDHHLGRAGRSGTDERPTPDPHVAGEDTPGANRRERPEEIVVADRGRPVDMNERLECALRAEHRGGVHDHPVREGHGRADHRRRIEERRKEGEADAAGFGDDRMAVAGSEQRHDHRQLPRPVIDSGGANQAGAGEHVGDRRPVVGVEVVDQERDPLAATPDDLGDLRRVRGPAGVDHPSATRGAPVVGPGSDLVFGRHQAGL